MILAAAPSWFYPATVTLLVALMTYVAAGPIGRNLRAKATIDLQGAEIEARDAIVERLRAERKDELDRFRVDLAAMEDRCREREAEADRRHTGAIAELRGQLHAQTPEFARLLAGHVAEALRTEGIGPNGR